MSKVQFAERMAVLAELCNIQLSTHVLRLYYAELIPFGIDAICKGIDKLIITRRSRDGFPSVRDIRVLISPETDDTAEAVEAANRIIGAIAKVGYYDAKEARKAVGELAWYVVEANGGWESICENMSARDVNMARAHFRDLALSVQKRFKAGLLDCRPSFDRLQTGSSSTKVKQLINGTVNALTEKK